VRLARAIQRALADRGIVDHRRRSIRFGNDPVLDVERLVPRVSTILDVGADEGDVTIKLADRSGPNPLLNVVPDPGPGTVTMHRTRDDAWYGLRLRKALRLGERALRQALGAPPVAVGRYVTESYASG
jgi:hypothetical protein